MCVNGILAKNLSRIGQLVYFYVEFNIALYVLVSGQPTFNQICASEFDEDVDDEDGGDGRGHAYFGFRVSIGGRG